MEELDPLGIFLVKSGSKGDRLLFRYPFLCDHLKKNENQMNNYSVLKDRKDDLSTPKRVKQKEANEIGLFSFDDKVLSNLFSVNSELCGRQFELKIENVRFVGHPEYLSQATKREQSTLSMFHIVFALKAGASHSVVNSYHDFSHRLSVAIHHEEQHQNYLTSQVKIMQIAHDEVAALPEGCEESPFKKILAKSQLARDLQNVYEDMKNFGNVRLKLNDWIEVSFCLPCKVHKLYDVRLNIGPESIEKSLTALRPYHGLLVLVDVNEFISSLPDDSQPALIRLLRVNTPLKNLQQLAADADIILSHVFQLVGHLVYWCKAMIIYPLCDSNVYIISSNAEVHIDSPLAEAFADRFPGMNLLLVLSQFSLPTSLSYLADPMILPHQQTIQVQTVIWMLQHRLLMQLHTYVALLPADTTSSLSVRDVHSEESLVSSSLSENQSKSGSEEELSLREQDYFHLSELTSLERNSILKESGPVSNDDLKNFLRLSPYFKGEHHLEEIMYCENIRRSQLLALLDKFRKVLVTYQFEDPAVAPFYSYS